MSVKWEKQEGNVGKLTFEIEQEKVKEGLDRAFVKVRKTLNVPGFRKGKVPRQIFNHVLVKKLFSKMRLISCFQKYILQQLTKLVLIQWILLK